MDVMVRLAMSATRDTMIAQSVNANNLANASTPGFRSDLVSFSRTNDTNGEASTPVNATDFRQGELQATGRSLDVAINGDGWMAVQAPDGTEAYSRRGDLKVNGLGQLTSGDGLPVMGDGGPISLPPFSEVEIGTDGTISILPLGQSANALAVVDRIRLVTFGGAPLAKGADGLIRSTGGEPGVADAEVELISGMLEQSNVNPIEALVRMIDLSRQFETQIKMMQTAEQNDESMSTVLRVS
ncbi:MAG: flagellar basal body rod protein FlgF [Pseudomonadota bacterium]